MTSPDTARDVNKRTLEFIAHGALNRGTSVLITTILNAGDHCAKLPALDPAKREGLYGLFALDTWKTVPRSRLNMALTSQAHEFSSPSRILTAITLTTRQESSPEVIETSTSPLCTTQARCPPLSVLDSAFSYPARLPSMDGQHHAGITSELGAASPLSIHAPSSKAWPNDRHLAAYIAPEAWSR